MITNTVRSPFTALDKPEPSKGNLKGWWWRRITGAHRLIYWAGGTGAERTLDIAQCRCHSE